MFQSLFLCLHTGFSVSTLILGEYFNQIQNSKAERSADKERDNPVLNADIEILLHSLQESIPLRFLQMPSMGRTVDMNSQIFPKKGK